MRFGQPGSKPRPVKVVCESSATVRSILKGSPGLKSSYGLELDPKGTRYYIRNGKIIVQLLEPTPTIAKSITSVSSTSRSALAGEDEYSD